MDSPSLAYIAGFIDGEGCISFHTVGKSGTRCYAPIFCITNNSVEVLEKIQSVIGGTVYMKHIFDRSKHNQSYSLNLTNQKDIIRALILIEPFLILKKEQAQIMIKYLQSRSLMIGRNGAITDTEFELIKSVKALNAIYSRKVKLI